MNFNLGLRWEIVYFRLQARIHCISWPHLPQEVVNVAVTRLHHDQLLLVQVQLGKMRLHGISLTIFSTVSCLLRYNCAVLRNLLVKIIILERL